MAAVPSGPVRRAQLISPFGVGAMMVAPNGISLVTAGLDKWYMLEDGDEDSRNVDIEEFRVDEWRLERALGVDHFRLPPDYRRHLYGEKPPNVWLTVPFQRFPTWHFCPNCYRLSQAPLSARGRLRCRESDCRRRYLAQVPFVAICDYGHIQDFPWREWVHRSLTPACDGQLYLVATGGATLAAQKVRCDCGAERPLAGITTASGDDTELTRDLVEGPARYTCRGITPWHGTLAESKCERPLRGSLRSASNVYFALVRSAIFLPRETASRQLDELTTLLSGTPFSSLIKVYSAVGEPVTAALLRDHQRAILQPYTDEDTNNAIELVQTQRVPGDGGQAQPPHGGNDLADAADEQAFRGEEFSVLREPQNHPRLLSRRVELNDYQPWLQQAFARIVLVDKLRETRALAGFNRIYPEKHQLRDRKSLLWREIPQYRKSWLPAYIVHGEGIFFEFHEPDLRAWEEGREVVNRVAQLNRRVASVREERGLDPREIAPRFLVLHTFAHLLMNQLTFECGYSSASLRERIFVSAPGATGMAGFLIYTAAGDAEGTMGGLVRMGKPEYLERTVAAALQEARWCSADPVCMEVGAQGGQGPDSVNLAACHNCALVPETACEEFNRFLDRGVVVGTQEEPELGFLTKFLDLSAE